MPKLWTETIDAHRNAVRKATLDVAAALVAAHGLAGVTMSRIAADTGIGRATLYKYFPDVVTVLAAWHERQIGTHLEHLAHVRDQIADPGAQLEAVLEAYALMNHHHNDSAEIAAQLHRGAHVTQAHQQLQDFIKDLLIRGASAGKIRDDITADELATYCLSALSAAGGLPSKAAVRRLVAVTLAGLLPPR